EEFIEEKDKSRKRRRDDQDPPLPPPKDSDHSKKKRGNSDASTSQQPQASPFAQPIDDIPIPDDVHLSNSEDIETPKPEWVIPLNELPKTKNNWADAITKTYKDPEENKLLQKTRDIRSFIKWYCRQIGMSKLSKADLEDPSFKVVRPFHTNNISLQFQMEECHLLLTNQIDLVNPEGNRVVPDVSKLLPLGGPPGHVTIQTKYFFNKHLEYLVSCSKERSNALSISKLKVANYPDFGLEELVPSLWIESEKRVETESIHNLSGTLRFCLILKKAVMDPVMQCTTLPSHSRSLNRLLFHFSRRFTHFYLLSHSELVDIEKVAVSSSL
ncbi:hypothetical protein Tco_1529134, partial [Tanacetum coccineum]